MEVKAVLFDMNGVITGEIGVEIRKELCKGLGIIFEDFENFCKQYRNMGMRGEIDTPEISRFVEEYFNVNDVGTRWLSLYREKISIDSEVMDLARSLMKKLTVGILSDMTRSFVPILKEKGVYEGFDPVIISCDVGMKKPEKGIYELALERVGVKAEECVFVDDREENLETPREMGIHTIHFRSTDQLKRELKELGVRW